MNHCIRVLMPCVTSFFFLALGRKAFCTLVLLSPFMSGLCPWVRNLGCNNTAVFAQWNYNTELNSFLLQWWIRLLYMQCQALEKNEIVTSIFCRIFIVLFPVFECQTKDWATLRKKYFFFFFFTKYCDLPSVWWTNSCCRSIHLDLRCLKDFRKTDFVAEK